MGSAPSRLALRRLHAGRCFSRAKNTGCIRRKPLGLDSEFLSRGFLMGVLGKTHV